MQGLATLTSKRQLTIPSSIFKKSGLKIGQKVLIRKEGGVLKIEAASSLVERLAGSISIPKRFYGKSIEEIIKLGKKEYFLKRK